jgi:uncharacterized protein YqjF (DUF2071 family)
MPAIAFQRWRDLLFIHWRVAPSALRPLVPPALALDLWDRAAWVTLIPFEVAESRPATWPHRLAHGFLEANLRTYVLGPDGETGIYFWSLEASSLVAVAGARLLYGLPYFPARMAMDRGSGRVRYDSERRIGPPASLHVDWTVGEALGAAAAGSLDHFLVERYALYVARGGAIYRARVRHRPYPLRRASVGALSETLLRAAGIPAPAGAPLLHYSPGVDVDIYPPHRARTATTPCPARPRAC